MERFENKESWIKIHQVSLTPPSLKDNTGDVDRLLKGLRKIFPDNEVILDLAIIKKVSSFLNNHKYNIQVSLYKTGYAWQAIELFPPDNKGFYGLSVDLGSTTITLRLLDIVTGAAIGDVSFSNPQTEIGPDILTRIHFASGEGGLVRLQSLVIKQLNKEISLLASMHGIKKDHILGISVAGNTTMTHLFLGLDPYWICREPYIPVINQPEIIRSSDLGLIINPRAPVFILPNVGSYFGGDLIAGILASGMYLESDVSILVDVGTNAEVVLGNNEWLMGCAGAAGPALEGGVTGMGMMAGPGVIDRVVIEPRSKEVKIRTIENRPPIGICGSGLIDLISQLYLAGMIDIQGRFVPDNCGDRLRDIEGIRHFIVVFSEGSETGGSLTLTQPDIDSLLRSKAAMYTILTTITGMINITFDDIDRFYIAGTFGTYLDPVSAITLGMIPDLPMNIFQPLGNSSLQGATMSLLSLNAQNEIHRIQERITYIELNVNQEFMNHFSAAKFIPHTDISLFPSVMKKEAG
ncbi:ASKHA domain-containing protein [Thermodesulfobacteriota bacterium]